MPYSQVKVYSDGSHYIGIPYEPNPLAKIRRPRYEEVIEVKEQLDEAAVAEDDAAVSEQVEQNLDDVQEKSAPPAVRQMTRKELFDELYMQAFDMKKRERKSATPKEKKGKSEPATVDVSSTGQSVRADALKETDSLVGKLCPVCGKGVIIKGKTAYGCSEWKNGCTYRKAFE